MAGIFAPAGHAEEGTPPKLDFVGGYFKDGVYHCYREPCFTIHRNAYPTKNNINFKLTDWPHWLDLDGNCQNEDLQTLYRESQTEPEYGEDDPCETIHSGSWIDPYTGQNIEEAWLMAVDHRISLQEAHLYGATAWPRKKRALFANAPDNLVAVSAKAQQERAYRGAKDWLPDNQQYWCEYVVHRERVAHMFELYFPPEEQAVHARIKQLYCKY
ncbi:MAG: hypothetical protein R3183_05030 [Oleiphilaceae bacterium]|nr:hypothetical protein [Oleiphilaceae bacterium]